MRQLLLTLILFLPLFADSYDVLNYERDYLTAQSKAIKEKKILMLIVVSDNCPWCKNLARRVLSKADVNATLQKDFVPVLVKNSDKSSFPQIFQTSRVPVINYIEPVKTIELWQSIGYRKKKDLYDDFNEAKLSLADEQN